MSTNDAAEGATIVFQYIATQHDKGLLNQIAHTRAAWERQIQYTTHWGTYRHVLRPEVRRIAAPYPLILEARVNTMGTEGYWEETQSIITEDATHIKIVLILYWK